MGRFAARLDYPTNAAEFQRADCAPRATRGDGAIKVSDWVQDGRYASGLDAVSSPGGPTNEVASAGAGPSGSRIINVSGATIVPGQTNTVSLTLAAQGNENALGLSLSFDPTLVVFTGASLGADAAGATLYVNGNQSGSGKLGLVLGLNAGASFAAGNKEVLRVSFRAASTASGSFPLSFADLPVPREVSDAAAGALPVSYVNSTVVVNSQPSLKIARSGTNINLTWPIWAADFTLQEASAPFVTSLTWSNLSVTAGTSNNESVVTLLVNGSGKLYRLYHP
jgi:hypothetical protein